MKSVKNKENCIKSDQNYSFFGEQGPCHKVCRILVLQSGMEPVSSAREVQSLNQWTTREVLRLLVKSSLSGSMEWQHSKSQKLPEPHAVVQGSSEGARVQYLMMGRSRPRCKLRNGGRTNTKGEAQRVRNTTTKTKVHTICRKK